MNTIEQILVALREQIERWEELFSTLGEEQIRAPCFDLDWSIRDVMAHLRAWQQISIAHREGGANDSEPDYPKWIGDSLES